MKTKRSVMALSSFFLAALVFASSALVAAQDEPNPAKEKLQQDLKAAVLNESITVAQLKDMQLNLAVLKEAKSKQRPGAPVDLMTPYTAVSKIKATMATVKQPDRDTLHQDFQAMMAARQAKPSAEADTPGKKLGKDVFGAVMRGEPTPAQVQQLQESLNSLQAIKGSGDGMLKQFRAMKSAKFEIEQTMNAGKFRSQDRQTVLDDLNNLGPNGGGGRSRRNGL